MKPTLLTGLPLVAVLTWVTALVIDPGSYSPGSVLLIGVGWLLLATVATVGLVLVGSRWARLSLITVLGTTLFVALVRPLDPISMVGLGLTAVALIVLISPGRSMPVRKLPSASGPPVRAVLMILGGLAMPLALGLPPYEPNVWVLIYAVAASLGVFVYARTITGGLAVVRFGLPGVAAALCLAMPVTHAIVTVGLTAAMTVLAWSTDVAVAFRPLIEKGTSYPIPPELAPREILEGARIDEKGRRV